MKEESVQGTAYAVLAVSRIKGVKENITIIPDEADEELLFSNCPA